MQRDINDRNTLGKTLNPYDNARRSTVISRTSSNYNDAKEKVQKIRDLINMGKCHADLAKYITGLLELAFQGVLDDTNTREKVAHPSYKDMERLDFQILLTENYYVNPSSIHICFPIKIKKKTNNAADIYSDMITVNNFFAHWIKETSVTKYGSDKKLPPTFTPWKIYQYSHNMLKHLPSAALKTIAKTLLYDKKEAYFAETTNDRRNYNAKNVVVTGLGANDALLKNKHTPKI